jgi:hypothetical protein
MWVYYLYGEDHSVRVEATVENPEEFIREVEQRTGLTLQGRNEEWAAVRKTVSWKPKKANKNATVKC